MTRRLTPYYMTVEEFETTRGGANLRCAGPRRTATAAAASCIWDEEASLGNLFRVPAGYAAADVMATLQDLLVGEHTIGLDLAQVQIGTLWRFKADTHGDIIELVEELSRRRCGCRVFKGRVHVSWAWNGGVRPRFSRDIHHQTFLNCTLADGYVRVSPEALAAMQRQQQRPAAPGRRIDRAMFAAGARQIADRAVRL